MIAKQQFVLGFIFDEKLEKVLLVKKERFPAGIEWMKGNLNGIGGHCEMGEHFFDTMIRECKEETGLEIDEWNHYCDLDVLNGLVHCFYTVTDEANDYKQIEDEELGLYWVSPLVGPQVHSDYTISPHMPNLEWLIPMALNDAKGIEPSEFFTIKEDFGVI